MDRKTSKLVLDECQVEGKRLKFLSGTDNQKLMYVFCTYPSSNLPRLGTVDKLLLGE